ncbi:MAG: ammonium transporter [Pseudomonadota bacterium]
MRQFKTGNHFRRILGTGSVLLLAAIPELAFAQNAVPSDATFILNTLLLLFCGVLVFFMHIGFTMLECGLVQPKNVISQLTKNFCLLVIAFAAYFLLGYNLMYPLGTWLYDGFLSGILWSVVLEPVAPEIGQLDDYAYATTGADFFFQMMFCAATATIVSGTIAERMRIVPFLIFVSVLCAVIYPVLASWKWGGGFLDQLGFVDFAGSTLVHSVGGWAALVGAIIVGPRLGRFRDDGKSMKLEAYSVPMASLGALLLWLGWLGFNGGSQLAFGSISDAADVSRIFGNTMIAAVGGSIAAIYLTFALLGKVEIVTVLNGSLGGLVAITAEPLFPSLMLSLMIGAVGGAFVVLGVELLDRMGIDDVISAIPVHLFAGVAGTLLVPLSNQSASFDTQFIGVIVYAVATVVLSGIVWFILNLTLGLRVNPTTEANGLDTELPVQY